MESERRNQPWGKLVKVDSCVTEVLLVNREYTVGRKKGCDLSFPANKLVSGEHCKIVQDDSGSVWLEDLSTNGTMINKSKLVKKQAHILHHGDIINFVYRQHEPEQNIAYEYQSIKPERGQRDHSHAVPSSDLVLSVEPVMLLGAPRNVMLEEPEPSTSCSTLLIGSPATDQTETTRAQETDSLEPERKRRKTDIDDHPDAGLSSSPEAVAPARSNQQDGPGEAPPEAAKTDKMEESLTCIICQDLLHDCVSLQPCMHTFCAACYSSWMERSSMCPTCRCPVERIRKNHILNNLVEAYLIQYPGKCRSEEDLKNMDLRNKITQDMLQPKVERSFSDEEGSLDYIFDMSDNDSDASDIGQTFVMCRECPGYREQPSTSSDIASASDGTADGVEGRAPEVVQGYRCSPRGCHIICTCCSQPMPDRRAELGSQQVAAQQCVVCQQPFCHMYWGCQKIDCQGCLARFSELDMMDKCLDGVLNNNNYESEILKNYLSSRGMSWRDVLQQGLQGLQQGAYYLSDYRISANAIVCLKCGLRAFKELAYKYRQNIPPSELPATVTARPDCYWGRNCRTQVKTHHATKFNHICDQTRFKS